MRAHNIAARPRAQPLAIHDTNRGAAEAVAAGWFLSRRRRRQSQNGAPSRCRRSSDMYEKFGLFIDNQGRPAPDGATSAGISPVTENPLGEVSVEGVSD